MSASSSLDGMVPQAVKQTVLEAKMKLEGNDPEKAESGRAASRWPVIRKWIALLGGAIVICLVLVIAANWSLLRQIATFSPIFLPNSGPQPATEAEARLQDIEYLASLPNYDRSFDEPERARFQELITSGR